MALLFEATDPVGRVVRCTQEQWLDHVVASRPFMEEWVEDATRAIEEPLWISSDAFYEDRIAYYYQPSPLKRYLKVVVKLILETDGELVTAYPTDSGKSGEKILWPIKDS